MHRNSPGARKPQAVLDGSTLTIEGVAIPVEHRRVPLKEVRLDPDNPRIQHAVRKISPNGAMDQSELLKLILELPGVPDLFKSIRDNKGLLEPIFIRPDGRIIEGNCRAASYLRLQSIDEKNSCWEYIPAVLVPRISDKQVAILQGHYHVVGRNKWRAYEQAGHLHRMRSDLGMDEKTIARTLGIQERDVIRDLKAYELMTEKLLPQMKGGDDLTKWSFVQELLKRKDLAEFRAKPANVDYFVSLVADKKIKKGADVRKLGTILKNKDAVKVLKQQDVDSAMRVVGQADPTADSRAFRKLKETAGLLRDLPSSELQRLRESEKPRLILQELYLALRAVAKAAGVKLSQ